MSEHEGDEAAIISLTERVEILEARLGIDPTAVVADAAESAARGAEAHAGNPQSDGETDEEPVDPEAEPESEPQA